jgi:hypothetical protein
VPEGLDSTSGGKVFVSIHSKTSTFRACLLALLAREGPLTAPREKTSNSQRVATSDAEHREPETSWSQWTLPPSSTSGPCFLLHPLALVAVRQLQGPLKRLV